MSGVDLDSGAWAVIPRHLGVVAREPTVEIDGEAVLAGGRLLV